MAVGQHRWDPILVGIGECTPHFRLPISVVGLGPVRWGLTDLGFEKPMAMGQRPAAADRRREIDPRRGAQSMSDVDLVLVPCRGCVLPGGGRHALEFRGVLWLGCKRIDLI